jgi:protein-S-isoprenylcysteine O-methyltransferase Ste14
MGYLLRHALAVLALPFMVAVVVPVWLARSSGIQWDAPQCALAWAGVGIGVATLLVGLTLFVASLRRFGGEGRGTLAPWDPPTSLVIRGPYSYVRNPMISGVLLVLVSEGSILRSPIHLGWAAVVALLNALYIPLVEEPGLRSRFGAEFDEYTRHVPRLVPRLTPWRGAQGDPSRPPSPMGPP